MADDYDRVRATLLGRTTHLVVVRGSFFDASNRKNNDVLASTNDASAIETTIDALRFEQNDRRSLMAPGDPTLAFLNGRRLLVAVVCVLPDYVRSAGNWEGDAKLVNQDALSDLLAQLTA